MACPRPEESTKHPRKMAKASLQIVFMVFSPPLAELRPSHVWVARISLPDGAETACEASLYQSRLNRPSRFAAGAEILLEPSPLNPPLPEFPLRDVFRVVCSRMDGVPHQDGISSGLPARRARYRDIFP